MSASFGTFGSAGAPKGKAEEPPAFKLPVPITFESDPWARFCQAMEKGPQEQEALLKDLAVVLRKKKAEVHMLSAMYDLVEKVMKE
jgi:hypothetical protein